MNYILKPKDVETLFDPEVPVEVVDFCMSIVRKGFEIGHKLGEKVNDLIDDMFDNLK